jgi:hypothetical protein
MLVSGLTILPDAAWEFVFGVLMAWFGSRMAWDPASFEAGQVVRLTLIFRRAGQVTIEAAVTAPGTP